MNSTEDAPLLRAVGLSKTFPGTRALVDVDLDVRAGEVHALVGHNGSGKSTLIKVLAGYHHPDPGASVTWRGHPVGFGELSHGHHGHGGRLSFVHQDLGLVLELDTVDNLALHGGYARHRLGGISWREQARRARSLLAPFDVDVDITAPLAQATPVERTIVAIAGALQDWSTDSGGVLVLDEPTAVLPPNEVERLFDIVRRLRASGAGVLYVSHRLDEVFDLADRVTVLRGGARVATHDVRDLDKQRLVELMLGAEARADYRADLPGPTGEEPLLSVRGLRGRYLDGVDVAVHPGEVLGIAGLPADGRDELPRLLTDARRDALAGTVRVAGSPAEVELRSWTDRTVALLPPDRAKLGILGPMSVGENVSLSSLARFGSLGRLDRRAERRFALGWIERLGVVTTGPDAPITTLSGGNQQKVLFGRTLAVDPTVLVLCEPTAGVDIGARQAIYELVAEQVRRGLGVVVASSDVGDLTALCTRVIVLHRGRVTTELRGTQLTEHDILHAMEGLERGAPR